MSADGAEHVLDDRFAVEAFEVIVEAIGGGFDAVDGLLGGFDGDACGHREFGGDDFGFDAGEEFEGDPAAHDEADDAEEDGDEGGDGGVAPAEG